MGGMLKYKKRVLLAELYIKISIKKLVKDSGFCHLCSTKITKERIDL